MQALIYVLIGMVLSGLLFWSRTRFADFLAQRPEDYDATHTSAFDLRTHLNGRLLCEGVIYGPLGRVSTTFVGEFDCHWQGNRGHMAEVFHYSDGTEQHRAWDLLIDQNGKIQAKASDVLGVGTGVQCGNAVQLKYRFQLPEQSGGHVMDVVDWMYLAPNGSIVNRSQFRKFGIKMAELVATIRKEPFEMKEAA